VSVQLATSFNFSYLNFIVGVCDDSMTIDIVLLILFF
jgi:hypothetical protein